MTEVTLRNVSVSYGAREAVRDVSFAAKEGQWWMLCGPNGAGKSTLLRAVSGVLPYRGSVTLNGEEIRAMKPKARGRLLGMLQQSMHVEEGFTVREIVALGRFAYGGLLSAKPDEGGEKAIADALEKLSLTGMADRLLPSLSGGERQRVFLAQVFAQQPRVLLLDEMENALDLPYQQQIFGLCGVWLREAGGLILCVTHDLSLALRYGTHAALFSQGRCLAAGEIRETLTGESLREAYRMDAAGWLLENAKATERLGG